MVNIHCIMVKMVQHKLNLHKVKIVEVLNVQKLILEHFIENQLIMMILYYIQVKFFIMDKLKILKKNLNKILKINH